MDFSLVPPVIGYILAGVFGAIIGSFLNVVIHRLPHEESVVFPNSRCPSCGAVIKFYDNIPILSYVALGAKCRSCKEHISFRYPAVEALTAALFVAVAWYDGMGVRLPFDLVFVSALLALVFIDAEHMILPNAITYPGIVFAVVARIVIPFLTRIPHFDDLPSLLNGPFEGWPIWAASVAGAVIGALVGGGSLWLMGWIWEKLRGVEAMGLGDVKMMFMVGAYLGWRLTIFTIFIGVLTGSIVGVLLMARQRERNMQMLLPFDLVFVSALLALVFIDAEHMILPNAITYPGIVFAVVARIVIPFLTRIPHFDDLPSLLNGPFEGWPIWAASLGGAVIGALAGGGSLWLMGWIWEKLRGIEAMGLGDVKMMFMVGAYLGWRLTIFTIFIGVLTGSIVGVLLMARQRERNMQMLLPFGIFLGLGAIASVLFGSQIVGWYAGQFR